MTQEFHPRRQRRGETVRQQNSQERAHQRRADLVADFRRRAVDVAHRDHDAQHGRHDAEAGQRVGHLRQRRASGRDALLPSPSARSPAARPFAPA